MGRSPGSTPSSSATVALAGEGWTRVCGLSDLAARGDKTGGLRRVAEVNGRDLVVLHVPTPAGVPEGSTAAAPAGGPGSLASSDLLVAVDASSTAFGYPLIDGPIVAVPSPTGSGGPLWAIESPLDGSRYFLPGGQVQRWCPGDTVPRKALAAMSDSGRAKPRDLPVHQCVAQEGGVWVRVAADAPAPGALRA